MHLNRFHRHTDTLILVGINIMKNVDFRIPMLRIYISNVHERGKKAKRKYKYNTC